jgi:3-deoxy-D-manno-octulosonic-acid transferase
MLFLYRIGLVLFGLLMQLAALWHPKAKRWVAGRKNLLERMATEIKPSKQHIWFHFASLGEFEQGRPVMEALKKERPETKLIITFFSPSGYEIRKNYELAEHVFYLPLDTPQHAAEFIRIVRPQLAVFTKYEYWYFYFRALSRQQIPLYIVSGIFRKDQVFFTWYGGLHRRMLNFVKHFFVQNQESIDLLSSLGFNNATLSGDTRFDRVYELAKHPKDLPEINSFCGESPVFIAGSTWPEDEALLAELLQHYPDWKLIIAPHEVDEAHIHSILQRFPEGQAIRYSELKSEYLKDKNEFSILNTQYSILVIDTIGLLSSLYAYGDLAYIGGGFGKGIHNTLEAAAYGIPVIFGPNYQKFQEAKDLIKLNAGFTVTTQDELLKIMRELQDKLTRTEAGKAAGHYVESKAGATQVISKHLLN